MKRYALLVGVQDYRDRMISSLQFARADAIALAKRLRTRCRFDRVRVLADKGGSNEPTLSNILTALGDFAGELREEDLFLFFFAGHGIERDEHSFLLTRDSLQAYPEHSLSLKQLRESFEHLNASKRILLLDTCRNSPDAGRSIDDNRMGDVISRDIRAVAKTGRAIGTTTALLSACRSGQRAHEWPTKRHGVFTHYLLQGIDSKAWSSDKKLDFHQLATYTCNEVRQWAENTPGIEEQEPWFEHLGNPEPIFLADRGSMAQANSDRSLSGIILEGELVSTFHRLKSNLLDNLSHSAKWQYWAVAALALIVLALVVSIWRSDVKQPEPVTRTHERLPEKPFVQESTMPEAKSSPVDSGQSRLKAVASEEMASDTVRNAPVMTESEEPSGEVVKRSHPPLTRETEQAIKPELRPENVHQVTNGDGTTHPDQIENTGQIQAQKALLQESSQTGETLASSDVNETQRQPAVSEKKSEPSESSDIMAVTPDKTPGEIDSVKQDEFLKELGSLIARLKEGLGGIESVSTKNKTDETKPVPKVITQDFFQSGQLKGGSGWIEPHWTRQGYADIKPSSGAQNGSYVAIIYGTREGSHIIRSVDLSSVLKPRFQFWAKTEGLGISALSRRDVDYAVVQVSKDTLNWVPVKTWVATNSVGRIEPWGFEDVDISSYAGTPRLWIKFSVFYKSTKMAGLYPMLIIDDLKITGITSPTVIAPAAMKGEDEKSVPPLMTRRKRPFIEPEETTGQVRKPPNRDLIRKERPAIEPEQKDGKVKSRDN